MKCMRKLTLKINVLFPVFNADCEKRFQIFSDHGFLVQTVRKQALSVAAILLFTTSAAWALDSDRKQKITLDGGGCVLRQKQQQTECPKGLTVKQGSMIIKAQYGLIGHQNKGVNSINMTGSPVRFEQKMESGELMVILAKKMDYIKAEEKIYLKGDVEITSDMGVTRGQEMEINLLTQEISSVSDDPDQQFHMEIVPDND